MAHRPPVQKTMTQTKTMKAPKLLLLSATLISFPFFNHAAPQIASTLEGDLHMGLKIDGSVGLVYAIQASTNLAQPNSWTCMSFVQLLAANYLWLDSAPAVGQRFYRVMSAAPTNFVYLPPGSFRMGSPSNEVDRFSDEGPQTAVTLTKGIFMGKYLVTQSDYMAVVGSNPSFFRSDPILPVEQVSWNDATNYCPLRTQKDVAAGLIPSGCHYRLP